MSYVPDAGDIIWIDFDPPADEQEDIDLLLCLPQKVITKPQVYCPLTTKIKGNPFECASIVEVVVNVCKIQ